MKDIDQIRTNVRDIVCNYTELSDIVNIILDDAIVSDNSISCEEDLIITSLDLLGCDYDSIKNIPIKDVIEVRDAFELALHWL